MSAWHVDLRGRFPALRSWTYLNSAAAGPIALDTARAGVSVYESLLGGGDEGWEQQRDLVEVARESLGKLAGASPRELAFTRNTSHSTSMIADMLWESGARTAVALDHEFPSSTLPFLNRGFDVRFVKAVDGRYPLAAIEEALDGRDVLVASHVMYRSGAVNDPAALGQLAEAKGAWFVLCCTQSLGALQVDFHASGADFLTGTSHKWLCAGYGGGFLGIREEHLGAFRWPGVGWLSQAQPERMRNDELALSADARVLEMGSAPFPSLLALGAAVQLWLACGPARVESRIRELTKGLRERLRAAGFEAPDRPPAELSGITVVPVGKPGEVCEQLAMGRVATTPRGGGVRIAVHAFNDERDLDRVVEGLAAITKADAPG